MTEEIKERTDTGTRVFTPGLDVIEKKNEFVVSVDLPGVTADGVDISLEGDMMTVKARVTPPEVEGLPLIHQEYNVGDYETALKISRRVDRDKIEADVKNGVLTLTLPKAKEARARQVKIKAA